MNKIFAMAVLVLAAMTVPAGSFTLGGALHADDAATAGVVTGAQSNKIEMAAGHPDDIAGAGLGHVKVGAGLAISEDGVLSATGGGATYTPTPISKVYPPVSPLLIVATNQSQVIVAMDKNITVGAPDASGMQDGQTVRWRFTAVGANRTVYWPTNTFKIPTSSAMVTNIVIVSGTTSIFATEYVQATGKWLIEAYVYGY